MSFATKFDADIVQADAAQTYTSAWDNASLLTHISVLAISEKDIELECTEHNISGPHAPNKWTQTSKWATTAPLATYEAEASNIMPHSMNNCKAWEKYGAPFEKYIKKQNNNIALWNKMYEGCVFGTISQNMFPGSTANLQLWHCFIEFANAVASPPIMEPHKHVPSLRAMRHEIEYL